MISAPSMNIYPRTRPGPHGTL